MSGALIRLLTPPLWMDENRLFSSHFLNLILLIAIPLTIVGLLYNIATSQTGLAAINVILVFALFMELIILVVIRIGHVIVAGCLFSFLLSFIVTCVVHDSDGILHPFFTAHFLIILASGLLIGGWAALLMSGLSIASGLLLVNRAVQGFLPVQNGSTTVWLALATYALFFIIAAVALTVTCYRINQYLIQAKRRSLEASGVSEASYRQLFEHNPQPMWVMDQSTFAFLVVNQAAVKQYGYSSDEFHRLTIRDISPGIERAEDVLAGEKDIKVAHHQKKDNTVIDVELSSQPLTYEGRPAQLIVAYDVTEREHLEASLRENVSRFRLALGSLPIIISSQDLDLRYTWIFNLTSTIYTDDVIGKRDADILAPEDEVPVRAIKERVIATKIGERQEIRITFKGAVLYLDISVEPLYDANRNIIGVTCFVLDITDRKRLQKELMQSEVLKAEFQKQRQIVSLRENFIRSVSHEFRTPLSIILSSKELLERYHDRLTPENRQQHLQKIGEEVDYMVQMLEDVLVVSKARAVGLEIHPETVDVEKLCHEVIEEIKSSYPHTPNILFVFQEQIGRIEADKKLIQYILTNLLSNAVKFSLPEQTVQLEVTRKDTSLIIQVTDHGLGIPREEQEHIFEPFYRAKNSIRVKGAGLGLALVQSSVEAYGGTIILDSTEGVGTTITISIPVFPESPT